MKNMRKLASLLLALVMVFAMATVASAASITINPNLPTNGTSTGETYKAYKILDATYEGTLTDDSAVSYTIDYSSPFYTVINQYATLTQVNTSTTYTVDTSSITDDEMANLSAALLGVINAEGSTVQADGTATGSSSVKIDDLEKGYYLVTSTLGSSVIVDTLGDETISTKNSYPTVTKTEDKATAAFDEKVTYTVEVAIPATAVGEIKLHDTMTGLTYNNDVSAKQGETSVTITANTTDLADGCTVEFVLSAEVVAANLGKTVTVTYSANVSANQIHGENKVKLEYSHYVSPEVKVEVNNYKLDVYKYTGTGESKTGLAGAGFVLKNADGKYYKLTDGKVSWVEDIDDATEYKSSAEGSYIVTFNGLANGTYTLVEKTVPAGYNQANDMTVEIMDANKTGETRIEVQNNSGSVLPSTGGMGTTLFYIVGGILVVAAVVLLVTKKRMAAAE